MLSLSFALLSVQEKREESVSEATSAKIKKETEIKSLNLRKAQLEKVQSEYEECLKDVDNIEGLENTISKNITQIEEYASFAMKAIESHANYKRIYDEYTSLITKKDILIKEIGVNPDKKITKNKGSKCLYTLELNQTETIALYNWLQKNGISLMERKNKLIEGKLSFVQTDFLKAYKNGGIVVLEEINLADPALIMGALGQAIEPPFVLNENGFQTVHRHPMCVIIATQNVGTVGSKAEVITITDRSEAIAEALNIAKQGDTILLAGKGHETYQVIGKERVHYDEREVVAEILK